METDLHQGILDKYFPIRKIGRLYGSDKIRLFESLEPSIILHVRIPVAYDDLVEGSGNDVLGIDRKWKSPAEV
jgi:hypothetical protein